MCETEPSSECFSPFVATLHADSSLRGQLMVLYNMSLDLGPDGEASLREQRAGDRCLPFDFRVPGDLT